MSIAFTSFFADCYSQQHLSEFVTHLVQRVTISPYFPVLTIRDSQIARGFLAFYLFFGRQDAQRVCFFVPMKSYLHLLHVR